MNSFDLTGRAAIVTGAGRGLGRAIALGLAEHGASVAVVDRDADSAQRVASEIGATGLPARAFPCDVGDLTSVESTVSAAVAHFGAIDILVNNAGITKRLALDDWTEADALEVIRVNQLGTFFASRAAGRHMVARRRGSVVNVSALGGGLVGLGRGNAIYCGTKGAVVAYTREFAAEWAPHGVRVNAVAPGWFRTEMNAPLLANAPFLSRILDRVPLARLGEPADIVGPVIFLASDASAMITGCLLPIDGGVSGVVSLSTEVVVR